MTTTAHVAAPRAPMTTARKSVLAAGILYIVTFIASIPALGLYDKILNHASWVLGSESIASVRWGALGEVITGLAGIGTAVVLYRVLKGHGPNGAVGFVASRTLEAAMIFVGVVSLLAVIALREDPAASGLGAHAALLTSSQALTSVYRGTFLLGPGLMPAVNALCFATILFRARLVPRVIPTIGLVGAVLLALSFVATLFGVWDQISGPATLFAFPIAAWELTIGVWMIVKGFATPTPVTGDVPVDTREVVAV
jgi:hypothetical protein